MASTRLNNSPGEYCLQQSFKILSHQKKIEFDKYTNVTSYYLITTELLNTIQQFLNFCQQFQYLYLNDKYYLHQFLQKTKKIKLKKYKLNDKSLRMSTIQIKL